jgi:peptidoglycan/LPS O-acetylase OafA/YrhL
MPHLLFYSNIQFFLDNEMQGALSPRWSLCVEEQFYLLWPFVILFTPAKYLKQIFIGLIVFANIFRIAVQFNFPDKILFPFLTPSNFDALSLGALLALDMSSFGKNRWYFFFEKNLKSIFFILFVL